MIPKSTAKLVPGDYCLIPRDDGQVVPFVFLCSVPGKRSYFYGALAAPPLPDADPGIPEKIALACQAMVHIECFKKNNTPIVGNAAREIGDVALRDAQHACTDLSVGTVHSVWGYRTIIRRAQEIEA